MSSEDEDEDASAGAEISLSEETAVDVRDQLEALWLAVRDGRDEFSEEELVDLERALAAYLEETGIPPERSVDYLE